MVIVCAVIIACLVLHACVCQVIVHEVPGQELEVEVFDKDPDHDDFLGRYHHVFRFISSLHVSFIPFERVMS